MNWMGIIWFAILSVVMYFIYKLIMHFVDKASASKKYSVDALAGIKLIVRFFIIFLVSFEFFNLLGVDPESLMSVSSISGIIIGFASTEIMSQIIAGLYLILARPFAVHDLVNVDGIEGIVMEIGMSYVVIQKFDGSLVRIPNKKIMDSTVKNYTIKLTEELRRRKIISKKNDSVATLKDAEEKGLDIKELKEAFGHLTEFMLEREVTRYTFKFQVSLSLNPYIVLAKLQKICKKYRSIYGFTPKCFPVGLGNRVDFKFRIYCVNPRTILEYHNNFLEDIANALYAQEGVV